MRTVAAYIFVMLWLGMLIGPMSAPPAQAATLVPPAEMLAGLVPGVSTLEDAVRLHGSYSIMLPGEAQYFAGGPAVSRAYHWSPSRVLGRPGLVVETAPGSGVITAVMVDIYPGIATSRGLSTLMGEEEVSRQYGMPDFAFEWRMFTRPVRELHYYEQGMIVILSQVPGRPNWTVTKLIVTHPQYLRTATSLRIREAMATRRVLDITRSYRVWAQMALP